MNSKLSDLLAANLGGLTVSQIISVVLTALACLVAVRLLVKFVRRLLTGSKLDVRVQKYLLSGLKALAYLVAAVIVISQLGVDSTSLVAVLSVCSLGLTLAAEDILGNLAGGIVILSSHPFAIGDFIEVGGTSGTVEEIALNHTRLITMSGQMVLIPNRTLSSSQMTNYTALGRRRVKWTVSASYDAPTETVKDACRLALSRAVKMLADPAPSVYLSAYGESAIEYSVFCWTRPEDYWDTYFSLGEQLRAAFAQQGVEMTYAHLNVHLIGEKD